MKRLKTAEQQKRKKETDTTLWQHDGVRRTLCWRKTLNSEEGEESMKAERLEAGTKGKTLKRKKRRRGTGLL
jgi:hypothetical protein